jgi:hypothetical protein
MTCPYASASCGNTKKLTVGTGTNNNFVTAALIGAASAFTFGSVCYYEVEVDSNAEFDTVNYAYELRVSF